MRARLYSAAMALAIATAALAPAAHAGATSSWVHLDGPSAGPQLALLRVGGTLNVVWAQGRPAVIRDTMLDPGGNVVRTVTVTNVFDGLEGLALVRMSDGTLRLFASGGHTVNLPPNGYGINSYVAAPNGTAWVRDASAFWPNPFASGANQIGAARTRNGEAVIGFDASAHFGLRANRPPTDVTSYQNACCGSDAALAVDGATGDLVMSWKSDAGPRATTLVQQIYPAAGHQVSLPIGTPNPGWSGVAGRLGGAGVYVAYVEQSGAVKLYRYGGGTIAIAAGAPFQLAKVFPGPQGRLWVVWGDTRDGVYVERSNREVTAFEPVQHFALPAGVELWDAQGEGSVGALDLFVYDLQNFWRTHILALDTLHATQTAMTVQGNGGTQVPEQQVVLVLTDAGDPVAGAAVTVSGIGATRHLTTDGAGEVTLMVLHSGTLHVAAAVPGYRTATLSVPVSVTAPQSE